MTCRERVFNAVAGKKTDRPPRFIWLQEICAQRLVKRLGIKPDEIETVIGNDVLQTWLSINAQMSRPAAQGEVFIDEFGITWKRDGYYNMVIKHPLAGLDGNDICALKLPDPLSPERWVEHDRLKSEYGKTHFIGADVSGTLFEPAYHIRGMEDLLCDLACGVPEADILLDKLMTFSAEVALEAARRGADWIWLGDDQGSERGMILGPELWRKYFKPRMKHIIDKIRASYPEMLIAYHSCGSVRPIIGDLVDIGINVLNPIQESAEGMNQGEIKRSFAGALTLMCGPDTQSFLPSAGPDEVRKKVRALKSELNADYRYIFAVSHTIQPDVPTENLLAMLSELDRADFS